MILTGLIVEITNPRNATYPKVAIIESENNKIPVSFYHSTTPILEKFLKIDDEVTLRLKTHAELRWEWDFRVELAVHNAEDILEVKRVSKTIIMKNGEEL